LTAILQRGRITPSERQAFEDIWDKLHRYKRLTSKQQGWVEKVYFQQKLDREIEDSPPPPPRSLRPTTKKPRGLERRAPQKEVKLPRSSRVAYINHPGAAQTLMVTNLDMLRALCPDIKAGSLQYRKIEAFFKSGGEVLKIKPLPVALQPTG